MKEMSLKDIQTLSLDILCRIDDFCRKYSIDYSLGYGGLIGAVRHKGFIPWDDDIDIIMPRPDYNKFIRVFNEDNPIGLKLYAPELGNSYYNITHICDTERTLVRKYYQWADEETGLWIDLFPIDGMPIDHGTFLREISSNCYNACGANTPLSFDFSIKRNLVNLGKRLKYGKLKREEEIAKYLQGIENCIYEDSTYVCNLASPYGKKDTHSKGLFSKYIRVPFENCEVSILENYHEYLTNIYGDYLTPPPVEKQVRGHSDNKYYWK